LKAQPPPVPARRIISHLLLAREAAWEPLNGFIMNAKRAETLPEKTGEVEGIEEIGGFRSL
jgi:hypothetical protein